MASVAKRAQNVELVPPVADIDAAASFTADSTLKGGLVDRKRPGPLSPAFEPDPSRYRSERGAKNHWSSFAGEF